MWNSSFHLGQDETRRNKLILDFVIQEMQIYLFLRMLKVILHYYFKKNNREKLPKYS